MNENTPTMKEMALCLYLVTHRETSSGLYLGMTHVKVAGPFDTHLEAYYAQRNYTSQAGFDGRSHFCQVRAASEEAKLIMEVYPDELASLSLKEQEYVTHREYYAALAEMYEARAVTRIVDNGDAFAYSVAQSNLHKARALATRKKAAYDTALAKSMSAEAAPYQICTIALPSAVR